MQREFTEVWRDIRTYLKPRMEIKYWGKSRGSSGKKFVIKSISNNCIYCDPPNAKNTQPVPRQDFEATWELWEDYMAGKVQRQYFTELTRFSSYIISIFHNLAIK